MAGDFLGNGLPSGYLIQLLLPLRLGAREDDRIFLNNLREDLTRRFGGVTAYTRAPAVGDWKDGADVIERDEIVIVEVMVEELEARWWGELKERIRLELDQEELIIRALPYQHL